VSVLPDDDASEGIKRLKQWDREHVLHPWRVQGGDPLFIDRAEGTRFWDISGKSYLDFTSQLVYTNLGHSNPDLAKAAAEQMLRIPAAASMFATKPQARLAHLLAEVAPGDLNRTFFSTTGSEAVEAAIKIARSVTGKHTIITRYRSYHGSTMGSASVTRDPRLWGTQVDPGGTVAALDPYCYRCPFGLTYPSCNVHCAAHIEQLIELNGGSDHVAAVIVEPITGANGVIVPPDPYLKAVRTICDRTGVLLIVDEIMTGFGRTGKWFACEHWGVVPDIMTVAKGLTNGEIPLAATLVSERIAKSFDITPFLHGHTYSGNTTACAVAVRAIELYRERDLVAQAAKRGAYLMRKARDLAARHPCIGDVRGLGLFVGLELVRDRSTRAPLAAWPQRFPVAHTPLADVLRRCRENGLFLMMSHPAVIHLAPPLIVEESEIDFALNVLDDALVSLDADLGRMFA
jgi:taurine--2-oxoglutarate transaminase